MTNIERINEDIKRFIKLRMADSLELEAQFGKIKANKWNNSVVLVAELNVQLGQLSMALNAEEEKLEPERRFDNIGDELSDILLNLLYLSYLEDVIIDDVTKYKDFDTTNLHYLTVILGKLSEVLLEKNGYRFKKQHGNYKNTKSYIKDLISIMYLIIFSYASVNAIDLNDEFDKMLNDARNFVNQKEEEKSCTLLLKGAV